MNRGAHVLDFDAMRGRVCRRYGNSRSSFGASCLSLMRSYLDFEKPVAELEAKVEELRALHSDGDAIAISEEINRIEGKAATGARRNSMPA